MSRSPLEASPTPDGPSAELPLMSQIVTYVQSVAGRQDEVGGGDLAEPVCRAFADTIAVAMAAANDPLTGIANRHAATAYGAGPARSWTTGDGLSAVGATFCNAVAGHVLDYDDVTPPMRGHPSVVLLPGLVALGEQHGHSCAELTRAYACGFEVLCKLACAGVQRQYGKGWHSTAVIGVVAAAAAGAALRGLDPDRTTAALALAVGHASGTRANFATSGKALQVGFAAAGAVEAVQLAELGATGSPHALDDTTGFARLYDLAGGSLDVDEPSALDLGGSPVELLRSGIGVKLYPCCYATHAALEATEALVSAHHLRPEQIAQVDVTVHATGTLPLLDRSPTDEMSAKFSMPFLVAATIVDGPVSLATFGLLDRPEIRDLAALVRLDEDDGPPLPRRARVVIRTRDGTELVETVDAVTGSAQRPAGVDRLQRKLDDCFAGAPARRSPRLDRLAAGWPALSVGSAVDVAAGLPTGAAAVIRPAQAHTPSTTSGADPR